MSGAEVQSLVGITEAASFLGLSEPTVRKYARHGVLPSVGGNGMDYRFAKKDLQDLKELLAGGWKPSFKN